jgi:hypothetical protein
MPHKIEHRCKYINWKKYIIFANKNYINQFIIELQNTYYEYWCCKKID